MKEGNEILKRTLKTAKNLMIIELKDRKKVLKNQIKIMQNDNELKILNGRRKDILNSEGPEIIRDTKWLQELVLAHQTAMFQFTNNILCENDQDNLLNFGSWPINNENDNIITTEGIIDITDLTITDTGTFTLYYKINRTLIPWIEEASFKIENYKFSLKENIKDILDHKAYHNKIDQLSVELRELNHKEQKMEDTLLRVETDLLLNQLKGDALGERAITSIGNLINKHMNGENLPTGLSMLPQKKEK